MSTRRTRLLRAADLGASIVATWVAAMLRFESIAPPALYLPVLASYGAFAIVARATLLYVFGVYAQVWRYASVRELLLLVHSCSLAALTTVTMGRLLAGPMGFAVPWSVLALDALLFAAAVISLRLLARVGTLSNGVLARRRPAGRRLALIIGAGAAGRLVAREVLEGSGAAGLSPVGFLDDDRSLHGKRIHGLPVLGPVSDLPVQAAALEVSDVVIAVPSAPGAFIRSVLDLAHQAGLEARTVPALHDLVTGRIAISSLRDVRIEDLLRREPVRVDMHGLRTLAEDRVVLVTGAGGSIGGELCRQLASLGPRQLILLGRGENSVFEIHAELRELHPDLDLVPMVADVKDARRIAAIVARYSPTAIFHAAAHKHVPLMEHNVHEAVLNNVVGTRNVVDAVVRYGVEHFVLISSDKAVRPTNVMGATKRVAEMVACHAAETRGANCVAVRFGNVLGSRGSVVPTFMRQIRRGGPITLTHPEMRRYFMTIPEAVRLVLQSAAIGSGGEVFCLDMGEQIRIVDLATDLVRLSGLTPGRDIPVVYTGTRPGEKLYEELFFSGDDVQRTEHPKIMKARYSAPDAATWHLVQELCRRAVEHADDEELRRLLRRIVVDYAPAIVSSPLDPIGLAEDMSNAGPSLGTPEGGLLPSGSR